MEGQDNKQRWRMPLMQKLYAYLSANNPDVLAGLAETAGIQDYLEAKADSVAIMKEQHASEGLPAYISDALLMEVLTEDLRPSKFLFVTGILEEEFPLACESFRRAGIFAYEGMNILVACTPVFEAMPLTPETENDRKLYYAVTGTIAGYLGENSEKENVGYGIQ